MVWNSVLLALLQFDMHLQRLLIKIKKNVLCFEFLLNSKRQKKPSLTTCLKLKVSQQKLTGWSNIEIQALLHPSSRSSTSCVSVSGRSHSQMHLFTNAGPKLKLTESACCFHACKSLPGTHKPSTWSSRGGFSVKGENPNPNPSPSPNSWETLIILSVCEVKGGKKQDQHLN
jgi:hypothetical protein